jgi:soluble lytic murein transglycosylase-like protein/rubrerythrin
MATSPIQFAELGLRGAFDLAILIEEDAQLRYMQLAARLGNDPGGAGVVFRMMVETEGKHRTDLIARRDAVFPDAAPSIDVSILGEGVEAPEVDEDELPATARAALEVALAAERRAYDFYRRTIPHVADPAVRAFFQGLMEEEVEHSALLERAIAAQPEASAPPSPARPRPAARETPPETYPDRAALESVLPGFDAATQAVARRAMAGMDHAEVAAALGVSRRAVARKLSRFLAVARQHATVALVAATMAGCAGRLTSGEGGVHAAHATDRQVSEIAKSEIAQPGPPDARAAVDAAETAAAELAERTVAEAYAALSALEKRVHAQVAERMRAHDPSVHRSVAQAILAEAKRARIDPLLVLALIHVESSFNPHAVSSAGAVGLMQLLEPTMRREVERSGLSMADPRDPVANVRAGVRYLKRLVNAFGETDLALMAYNAGPNRIRAYLRSGGVPERFHEYPQRINGELQRLRRALGTERSGAQQLVARGERPPPSEG